MTRRPRPRGDLVRRLGDVMRRTREAAGLRQCDCAAVVGLTADAWRKIERARQKDIGLLTFCRVAAGLGLRPSDLLALVQLTAPNHPSSPLR